MPCRRRFATTVGAVFGAALSIGIDLAAFPVPIPALKAILLSDTVHMTVRVSTLLMSVVFLTVCTGLAALWPSFRAARMRPIVALGYVS